MSSQPPLPIAPPAPQYPSILVIGFGELGKAIINSLINHPAASSISVLIRPASIPSVTEFCSRSRVNIVPSDYIADSVDALAAAFQPFHTVIGASGYVHGAANVQTKLAAAVLKAKVQRYFPWQFGVDYDILGQGSSQDLFDEQLQVRRMLRGQTETAWVIVSVGLFMSYVLNNEDFGVLDLETRTARALGRWDTQITVTDARDIGEFTVGILMQNDPEVRNEVVFIAGQTLTYGELADILDQSSGGNSSWQRELWTREKLMQDLAEDPENGLKKYRPVFASETGIAWSHSNSWNGKRGLTTRNVADVWSELRVGLSTQ